jgi:RHS repeat-associated protein
MRNNGAFWHLLSDHLGSTSITLNSAGTWTGELRYTAWGETRSTQGTTLTPLRYTGQSEDTGLPGLYFYQARWYFSPLGRFAQADTIVPGVGNPLAWDRYAYTSNNPINRTDPTGHRPVEDGGPEVETPVKEWWNPFAYETGEVSVKLDAKVVLGGEGYLSLYFDQKEVGNKLKQLADAYIMGKDLSNFTLSDLEFYVGLDFNFSAGASEEISGLISYSGHDGSVKDQLDPKVSVIGIDGVPIEVSGCPLPPVCGSGGTTITANGSSSVSYGLGVGEGVDLSVDVFQTTDWMVMKEANNSANWQVPYIATILSIFN